MEDEVAGCCVQLTRDENYELPFRIVGPFHVDDGMHNRMLLEDAKAYLHVITIANQASAARGRVSGTARSRFAVAGSDSDSTTSAETGGADGSGGPSKRTTSNFFTRWLTSADPPSRSASSSEEDKPFVSAREWIGVPS